MPNMWRKRMNMLKIKPARGLIKWFLNFQQFKAITIPYMGIYIIEGFESAALIRHERKHEEQINRLGAIRFVISYWYFCFKFGYYLNPFEVEARAAE